MLVQGVGRRGTSVALAITGSLLAAACAPTEVSSEIGRALTQPFISGGEMRAIGPGAEWVAMFAFLKNQSGAPLMLREAEIEGQGVGDVVTVFAIEVAPLPPLVGPGEFTPGGIFVTDPPTMRVPGQPGCTHQTLTVVGGFELPAGGEARLAVFMRAVAVGSFHATAHVVTYEQDGRQYVQTLPVGLEGNVTQGGGPVEQARAQRACFGAATLLATAPEG